MNQTARILSVCMVSMAFLILSGCEDKWEDSGDGFNTSQGAGINVNFSGVYTPLAGTDIIPAVGESAITRLVLTQIGNTVEVMDDYGKTYQGFIGSPGVMTSSGNYPSGATMMQGQISFSGNGVDFVGTVRAVAVTDVRSTTTTSDSESYSADLELFLNGTRFIPGSSTNIQVVVTEASGGEVAVITLIINGISDFPDGDAGGLQVSFAFPDGTSLTFPVAGVGTYTYQTSMNRFGTTSESSTQFVITDANTRYIIQGSWIRNIHDDSYMVEVSAPAMRGSF